MSSDRVHIPLPPRHASITPQNAPVYLQPVLLSTYSHLPDRSTEPGDESMAYYRPAPLGADLSYGLERRIERDPTVEEHLDGLCDAVQRTGGNGLRAGSVVTWRGMLTRMMTAPFEDREGWQMNIVALGGSVYIEQHEPKDVKDGRFLASSAREQSSWALQSYMGYAFEAYSTYAEEGKQIEGPPGWSGDVNTNVQWCNIVRSAINDIPLYLGGEVDCVLAKPGDPHPGLQRCIELKTNKVIESEKQDAIFHKKLLKHWAQSFLLGIEHIEVGFRDDAGILHARHNFDTFAIPSFIAKSATYPWQPSRCLQSLHDILRTVTTHVLPTDPMRDEHHEAGRLPSAIAWRLEFQPRRGCELRCLGEVESTDNRWGGMLPMEYARWVMDNFGEHSE